MEFEMPAHDHNEHMYNNTYQYATTQTIDNWFTVEGGTGTIRVCRDAIVKDLYGNEVKIKYGDSLAVESDGNGVYLVNDIENDCQRIQLFNESGIANRLNSLRETVNAMNEADPIKNLVKKELKKIMEDCGL